MFVVASVFKNEAPLLREWVEHYLAEGAAHLFLVDHGSVDDPWERVRDYADRITWFRDDRPFEAGVQTTLLNAHVLPKVSRGKCWVFVCDVDEYLYAPHGTVAEVLRAMPPHVYRMWIPWKVFGSNGFLQQPESVVHGFTHRASGISLPYKKIPYGYQSHLGTGKMVVRGVVRLHIHESETMDENTTAYAWDAEHTPAHLLRQLPATPLLELNHYMFMSRAYYQGVKCVRGGGQTGHATGKYTMAYFDLTEPACNSVEDTALSDKKKGIIQR